MRRRPPYVQDSLTGESRTREFVEAFLESYISPTQDGLRTTPSVYDTIFSTVAPPQEVLYPQKSSSSLKSYIGRAAPTTSGSNPDEYLWCVVADVSKACRRLTPEQRQIVKLKYIRDLSEYEIAHAQGVPVSTVTKLLASSVDTITAALDGK